MNKLERRALAKRLAAATAACPNVCVELVGMHQHDLPTLRELELRLSVATATADPHCPACYLAGRSRQPLCCTDPKHRTWQTRLRKHQRAVDDARVPAAAPVATPKSERLVTDMADMADLVRSCTSKKRYLTLEMADLVALKCWEARQHRLRVYPCELCGGFHLTHLDAPPAFVAGPGPA